MDRNMLGAVSHEGFSEHTKISVSTKERATRQYLAVPYDELQFAKAAGALWDKAAKSWYAGPYANKVALERWTTKNSVVQQQAAMPSEKGFSEALRHMGCILSGDHPIMDGRTHRIEVEGDKKGEKAGFYVAHLDGHPAAYIKNNRTGIEMVWKSKGYYLSQEQKIELQLEATAKLANRAEQQNRTQEKAAERVTNQIQQLMPITTLTPYLEAKGITQKAGIFTDSRGQTTYIPASDEHGKQWTMQYIQKDGTKRFAKESRKEGCFHAIGGLDKIASVPVIVISEGYATAASISQALGFSTIAAFDSGNIETVAKALHAKFPDKPIVIAGDDDQAIIGNPGKKKAKEAAFAVGGTALFPIFAPGEQSANPKDFTDFNDLANKSVLGIDGLKRQIKCAVSLAIENYQRGKVEQTERHARKQTQQVRKVKV